MLDRPPFKYTQDIRHCTSSYITSIQKLIRRPRIAKARQQERPEFHAVKKVYHAVCNVTGRWQDPTESQITDFGKKEREPFDLEGLGMVINRLDPTNFHLARPDCTCAL